MTPAGRRTGRGAPREQILGAARELFGESGFEGATVRAIAARAAVDPALLYHYFGTKERLFVAAMELPFQPEAALPALLAGPPDRIGERFVRFWFSIWDDPQSRPLVLGLLRSAVTDPLAATMIREVVMERAVGPLVESLGMPDARLRATLVGSQLIGAVFIRYVVQVEPLASASIETIGAALGPTIQRYLAGAIDGTTDPAP